jgi:N-acetylglucosaminyldiphosphoundecaprenol N-acetyl-beta-D-mannosaminyltransferase
MVQDPLVSKRNGILPLADEKYGPIGSNPPKEMEYQGQSGANVTPARFNELTRNVYCVLGLPIDATDIVAALAMIDVAAARRIPFLISTPNLNFLVISRSDKEFKESLLESDFCIADGMPIVRIARLLGIPIRKKVSGSDIFEALKTRKRGGHILRIFLFGGKDGVAATAASAINTASTELSCVGAMDPGLGTVEDMSREQVLKTVNASGADFLIAALGARKGQLWLHRNHDRLTIPVRAHFGAVINFAAGTLKRAPRWLQVSGLEWLWRIKEEPHLWRRYAYDGFVLLRLMITHVLPLAVLNRWHRLKSERHPKELTISTERHHESVTVRLCGDASEQNINTVIACVQEVVTNKHVVIDLCLARAVDSRFLGFLMMLRKCLQGQGRTLEIVGVSPAMRRLFRLNEVDFLLNHRKRNHIPYHGRSYSA